MCNCCCFCWPYAIATRGVCRGEGNSRPLSLAHSYTYYIDRIYIPTSYSDLRRPGQRECDRLCPGSGVGSLDMLCPLAATYGRGVAPRIGSKDPGCRYPGCRDPGCRHPGCRDPAPMPAPRPIAASLSVAQDALGCADGRALRSSRWRVRAAARVVGFGRRRCGEPARGWARSLCSRTCPPAPHQALLRTPHL